jgi:hypothetical protein
MSRISSLASTVLVVALAGCADPNVALVIVGTPVAVRAEWKPIWADMQACTGTTAPLARVNFYQAAGEQLGGPEIGAWVAPHNIYLADYVLRTDFTTIDLHEMIHDLIGVSDPRHLNPLWKKCDPNYAFIEETNR